MQSNNLDVFVFVLHIYIYIYEIKCFNIRIMCTSLDISGHLLRPAEEMDGSIVLRRVVLGRNVTLLEEAQVFGGTEVLGVTVLGHRGVQPKVKVGTETTRVILIYFDN